MSIQRFTGRLEAEPELLIELCTATKGTPGYEAVYRFVRTPEGKERLLKAYLEAVFASGLDFTSSLRQVRTHKDGAWLLLWLNGKAVNQMSYWDMPNWAFQGAGSGRSVEHH